MIAQSLVLEARPHQEPVAAAVPALAPVEQAAPLTMQGVTASLQLLLVARRAARIALGTATAV